jgi:hypothetical protein
LTLPPVCLSPWQVGEPMLLRLDSAERSRC